jgi:hypothetical protein
MMHPEHASGFRQPGFSHTSTDKSKISLKSSPPPAPMSSSFPVHHTVIEDFFEIFSTSCSDEQSVG